jgi:hypothetical protein
MHDLGLVKLHTGLRMLVCVPVGLAAGYAMALLVGLPPAVGLMLGALPAFLTCFMINDDRASRVAARSAVTIAPFVLALFGSLALHPFRFLELALMVVLLFLQFYANRFGVWAADFTAVLFAAYLCGLLLPLPLTSFEGLAAVGAASLASTIVVRSIFFRPNAHLSLLRTRRAFTGWSARVIVSAIELVEAEAPAVRNHRRLVHRLGQLHGAALVADGLLSRCDSGLDADAAENLHRLLFDVEQAIDGIGRTAERFAVEDVSVSGRAHFAAALRPLRDRGGRMAGEAAAVLEQWTLSRAADGDHGSAAEAREIRMLVALLRDLQVSAEQWVDVKRTLDATGGEPFLSSISLVGGRVVGAVPILGNTLAEGGMTGFWGRLRISAPLRTALQAAIAVAIVEPIAFWLGGDRFYWGVIGVMVILAGTNSTHERLRKVLSRGIGTVVGGILGIAAVDALGTSHVWVSLALIVVCLALGAYWFATNYWVWVVCLVVAICQVYAFAGGFQDSLLPLRLAENMLGAGIAVLVSLVVLPVATGAMIRSAVKGQLRAVRKFVRDVDFGSSPAATVSHLRADARAIDQATFGLNAVMKPLVRATAGGQYWRDEETRTTLAGIARSAREIASAPALEIDPTAEQMAAVSATAARIAGVIDDLIDVLDQDPRTHRSARIVFESPEPCLVELPGVDHRLLRIEAALASVARLHGLTR